MSDTRPSLQRRALNLFLSNLDSVATALKYLVPSTFMGVLVGWSVWFTEIFQQAAPASWVIAGLAAWFATALGILCLTLAKEKSQLIRFRNDIYDHSKINPLETVFRNQRIRVTDLAPPVGAFIDNRTFIGCDIVGPANLMFDGCTMIGNRGEVVDGIIVRPGYRPSNGFGFRWCTFQNCRFYLISFMVPEPQFHQLDWTGMNWITDKPEELNLLEKQEPSNGQGQG